MSDEEFDDMLNFYSTKSTTSLFKKQLKSIGKSTCSTKLTETLISQEVVKSNNSKLCSNTIAQESDNSTLNNQNHLFKDQENIDDSVSIPCASTCDEDVQSVVVEECVSTVPVSQSRYMTRSKRGAPVTPIPTASNDNPDFVWISDCEDDYVTSSSKSYSVTNDDELEIVEDNAIRDQHTVSRQQYMGREKRGRSTSKNYQKKKLQPGKKDIEILNIDSSNFSDSFADDENYEVFVKVIWKSAEIIRIPVRKFQKLDVLFQHFMKLENVPQDRIMLTFKGVTVKETDTPDLLNIEISDFIDGGVLNSAFQGVSSSDGAPAGFHIKFQDNNKRVIRLPLREGERMNVIMNRFAEQVNVPLQNIKFLFDGDVLNGADTPETLGLETGEVIDVVYLS